MRHRAAKTINTGPIIIAGPLSLNTESRELEVDGKKIELTKTEYDF